MPTLTRRERVRSETIAEIKHAAYEQLAARGAASLSIRGVARDIGMSPAGIYRYYDSLDALITDLVTDAYEDLALTVETAVGQVAPVRTRFRAGMHAYRDWAKHDPQRFLLLFGTPIPGYAAPEDGPTERANRRVGAAFFGLAADALGQGELHVPDSGPPSDPKEQAASARLGVDLPAAVVPQLVSAYAHMHGLVTLEILGQLTWVYPDADAFYTEAVEQILDSLLR